MVTECRQRDGSGQRPGVLIIVQNLPVPLDRRVWLECLSLAWIHQKQAYVAVVDELVGRKTVVPATDGVQPAAPTDLAGAEA